ncbi:hypothetical protein SHXM_01715 [Streptomyces hygroscopicus]|nr:hypothetical protein SHXM_01715 [Streptomyces hygroscopicus]
MEVSLGGSPGTDTALKTRASEGCPVSYWTSVAKHVDAGSRMSAAYCISLAH